MLSKMVDPKIRCATCSKKLGLVGFVCRCGGSYCSLHRSDIEHKCSFDYGAEQRRQLSSLMIKIEAKKVDVI
jgi:predicted nucleic acid binding AN1-type Zn finger protein